MGILALTSLALTGWVAIDASHFGRSWYAWSRLVFFTGIFGAAVWFLVRRRSTRTDERLGTTRTLLLALAGVPLLFVTALSAALFVTFIAQPARVQGEAMSPTLQNHDRVIVNKLVYRLTAPRPGDVVMLSYPLNPEKMFVKRVIAVSGDAVQIVDGRVYVNDALMKDDYVTPEFRSHDDWGPQRVAEGYYFVLGDHRNNSSDSRHWGLVPKNYILGKISEARH